MNNPYELKAKDLPSKEDMNEFYNSKEGKDWLKFKYESMFNSHCREPNSFTENRRIVMHPSMAELLNTNDPKVSKKAARVVRKILGLKYSSYIYTLKPRTYVLKPDIYDAVKDMLVISGGRRVIDYIDSHCTVIVRG